MLIEKTDKEILIRIPSSTDIVGVQRLLDYLSFREIASESQAKDAQIIELARQSKSEWWKENKHKYFK